MRAAACPSAAIWASTSGARTSSGWSSNATPPTWRVIDRDQVPTPAEGGPDAVVARLAEVGAEAIGRSPGITTLGIGIPGLYDPVAGTTRFLVNVPGAWAGRPVAGPVGAALGLPACLINDARAFGLAELRLGAGRGAGSMIGLTLGTGVGGVIAIDGHVYQGHDGTGGELGHQTLDADGPLCGCGNRGCLEAFARADRIAAACGTDTAEAAFEAARAADPRAIVGLALVGRYLGIGIANMIVVVTPDVVVIGGGIAAAFDLLRGTIEAELLQRVHTTALDRVAGASRARHVGRGHRRGRSWGGGGREPDSGRAPRAKVDP